MKTKVLNHRKGIVVLLLSPSDSCLPGRIEKDPSKLEIFSSAASDLDRLKTCKSGMFVHN